MVDKGGAGSSGGRPDIVLLAAKGQECVVSMATVRECRTVSFQLPTNDLHLERQQMHSFPAASLNIRC